MIAFLVTTLNNLGVYMFDIGNAYLNTPGRKQLYTYIGPEFGGNEDKLLTIKRVIYGLKTLGAAFRDHFATISMELGLES